MVEADDITDLTPDERLDLVKRIKKDVDSNGKNAKLHPKNNPKLFEAILRAGLGFANTPAKEIEFKEDLAAAVGTNRAWITRVSNGNSTYPEKWVPNLDAQVKVINDADTGKYTDRTV